MKRRREDIGDGDICPIVPEHGHMLTVKGTRDQFCPDQSHDGPWTDGYRDSPTRSAWPLGIDSFARAVRMHTLPEIDIDILKGVQSGD